MRRQIVLLAGLVLIAALLPVPSRADDGTLLLQAEGEQRTIDCASRDVRIEGNRNRYILRGGCRSIVLRGEADDIQAQMIAGGHIDVEGNGVLVTWSLLHPGPDVSATVNGQGSRVMAQNAPAAQPATPPATPPATASSTAANKTAPEKKPAENPASEKPAADAKAEPPHKLPPLPPLTGPVIDITISGEARDLDCTGKSVRITADRGLYALRGGCRAVEVQGTGDFVQAEILPTARVVASGADTRIAWVKIGTGAAPDIRATDGASAWQIPALGDYHPDPAAPAPDAAKP